TEFLADRSKLVYVKRESLKKFSPDSLSVMEFQSRRDYEVAEKIYGEWPLLGEEPHPPTPSPLAERGSQEVSIGSATGDRWFSSGHLWEKLKPLAKQMRVEPTPAEGRLWEHLRNRQVNGLKFRRQHSIERFVVDFYCAEEKLIVE